MVCDVRCVVCGVWCVVYVMGWLQSVGSIKSQVSFAEYCLFCRAFLQKRPIILSILLTKAIQSIVSNARYR